MTWPPDYLQIFKDRAENINRILKASPQDLAALDFYYKDHPVEWIEDWAVTIDPRNAPEPGKIAVMPFILFPKQRDMVLWLFDRFKTKDNGAIDKCRDMGATWVCSAFSVWMWRYYPGAAIGWGSRKEALVDCKGDPKSIFEKIRAIIDNLPGPMLPRGYDPQKHDNFMKILNPDNGATITGEAGDNIGRGGRTTVYFKDESAFYERPAKIEAALGENTNTQIDLSTHNGTATLFYRKTQNYPAHRVFTLDWWEHPEHDEEWLEGRKTFYIKELGMPSLFAQHGCAQLLTLRRSSAIRYSARSARRSM
jgi:hypothetical protein